MTSRILIAAAIPLACIAGCKGMTGIRGSGVAKTETRELAAFDSINLSGVGRLEVTIGKPGPITLTTDDNLLPMILTEVTENRLTIREREGINPQTPLVMSVTTATLKRLTISGAANCSLKNLESDALDVTVSGAATLDATGSAKKLVISLSGAGDIKAFDLHSDDVTVKLSGAGAAEVNVAKTLSAEISGVGTITYLGDPKVEKSITGIGKITRKEK